MSKNGKGQERINEWKSKSSHRFISTLVWIVFALVDITLFLVAQYGGLSKPACLLLPSLFLRMITLKCYEEPFAVVRLFENSVWRPRRMVFQASLEVEVSTIDCSGRYPSLPSRPSLSISSLGKFVITSNILPKPQWTWSVNGPNTSLLSLSATWHPWGTIASSRLSSTIQRQRISPTSMRPLRSWPVIWNTWPTSYKRNSIAMNHWRSSSSPFRRCSWDVSSTGIRAQRQTSLPSRCLPTDFAIPSTPS